jgi:hypothetical protein
MLARGDFSERGALDDLGRLERTLVDAGRRGVPGIDAIMPRDSPPTLCAQSGVCLRTRRVWRSKGEVEGRRPVEGLVASEVAEYGVERDA